MQWSYIFLALTHWNALKLYLSCTNPLKRTAVTSFLLWPIDRANHSPSPANNASLIIQISHWKLPFGCSSSYTTITYTEVQYKMSYKSLYFNLGYNKTNLLNTQCGAIIMWLIFSKFLTVDTHSLPERVSYGVSVVYTNSDLCSASVTGVLQAISCCIGPRYKDIQLYIAEKKLLLIIRRLKSNSFWHLRQLRNRRNWDLSSHAVQRLNKNFQN